MPIKFMGQEPDKNSKGHVAPPVGDTDTPEDAIAQLRAMLGKNPAEATEEDVKKVEDTLKAILPTDILKEMMVAQETMDLLVDKMLEVVTLREEGKVEESGKALIEFSHLVKEKVLSMTAITAGSIISAGVAAMAELEWREKHGER